MAKTRVCDDLFMRKGCGDPFRVRRFSKVRQCPRCRSGFMTQVDFVEQSGPVRIYDVGLFGRRSNVLAVGTSNYGDLFKTLNGLPEAQPVHIASADIPHVPDLDAAGDLGRRVGMFMPTLQPHGVIDGDTVGGDFMFERRAING